MKLHLIGWHDVGLVPVPSGWITLFWDSSHPYWGGGLGLTVRVEWIKSSPENRCIFIGSVLVQFWIYISDVDYVTFDKLLHVGLMVLNQNVGILNIFFQILAQY